ncbi:hypothetical protein [Paenibacillus illinoisensis]|uniref:hypothetical protein n=1 Tax=Paenibacillus illinoisensis TaxID=59845 RepID=UPI003D95A879
MSSQANTSENQDEVIIGARALGDQIYKIMPTYDLLLEQLNEISLSAVKQLDNNRNLRNALNKQDYNNTVGIFGPRGTGKSSALYTLRVKLSEDTNNILLPLIEPDNFGENTKIIGSIVGLLCEEGKKLLHILKNTTKIPEKLILYFNNGVLKPNNPLKQIIDETIEYHLYTERQYRDILGQNYADLATHIRKSERLLIPDIEFKKKLMILIDTIIDVKYCLMNHELSSNDDKNTVHFKSHVPLIYIFIDDIDLKTSKTRELMDALLQYTNHPNIITVLSGDYEILTESLTLALLQDEPLQELGLKAHDSLRMMEPTNEMMLSEQIDKKEMFTILKRKTSLAHEYLKKIIPPARRHQLVKWNENTIPNFAFGKETLMNQLIKLMGDWSIFSYKEKDNKESELNSESIKWSYIIFDERPRGIVNAYYHLNQLLKAQQNENLEDLRNHFQLVKAFVDTLILSNTKLLPQQEFIYEKFLLWGSDSKSSSIKYEVLNELKGIIESKKELTSLRIILYVIGELINSLLPEVTYDEASYFSWRKQVVNDLLLQPKEINDKTDEDVIKQFLNHNQYSDYRLFFLVQALALLAEPEISALLTELISNTDLELYYKSRWASKDTQSKDEFVIKTIHTLLLQEDEMKKQRGDQESKDRRPLSILEELYHQAYYNQNVFRSGLANFSLNLLESLCAETAETLTAERQFKLLMEEWDYAIEKEKEELEKNDKEGGIAYPNRHQRLIYIMDLQIKRFLFLNSVISIMKMDKIPYKFDKNSKEIGHTLSLINSERQNTEDLSSKVPDAVYLTLENRMKNFGKELRHKFMGNEISVQLDNMDRKDTKPFLYNYSGSSQTRYDEAKKAFLDIHHKDDLLFNAYSSTLKTIEKLSQNNRVYYGRPEAAAFLPKFRSASRFSIETFSELEKATIQQYAKYVGANQIETKIDAYENAKKFIQGKLNEAHHQFQLKTLADTQGYNLELQDLDNDQMTELNSGESIND